MDLQMLVNSVMQMSSMNYVSVEFKKRWFHICLSHKVLLGNVLRADFIQVFTAVNSNLINYINGVR
jgi:hypothetical protein